MKTALILTSINIPTVLALYYKYGPGVEMFVAFDEKTAKEAMEFCITLSTRCNPYYVEHQRSLGYACSEIIGFSNIQRRNIALLEAVKWGAEFIITIDDDNTPLNKNYFEDYCKLIAYTKTNYMDETGYIHPLDERRPFNGIKVSSPNGWFDPGQLLTPTIRHRGMPLGVPSTPPELSTITDAKIGVAVGLWVGDADVDATHRIANPPLVHSATALAEAGVVLDPDTKTVWNAQNVGFIRELAPAMFQMPFIGRADDIFASLITQRVMREHGLHVHIGKPFTACWQNRSTASMIRDLEEEILLYKYTADFAHFLDNMDDHDSFVTSEEVISQTRSIYYHLSNAKLVPKQSTDAALAFLDDLEKVL